MGGGLTTVAHDQTLTGDGTAGNPLGIATSGVGTAQLANHAVTSEKNAANNSFFGRDAGASNINGSFNAFFGAQAGINNTTGIVDVFLGHSTGRNNTTGSSNTVVGSNAGLSNTTEGGNTFIGFSSNGAPGVINSTAIGALATVTQSNSVVLGSNNVNVGIGTTAPQAKLHVNGGSILVSSAGQGVILKSPDGSTCRTLTIDNSGNLLLVPTTCPL